MSFSIKRNNKLKSGQVPPAKTSDTTTNDILSLLGEAPIIVEDDKKKNNTLPRQKQAGSEKGMSIRNVNAGMIDSM